MFARKRVYDPPSDDDRYRVLVDRLWPRGMTKERAAVDLWLRDVAPSTELRRWYGHEPDKWLEFRRRYREELASRAAELAKLRELEREHGIVTLLFAARDTGRNEAAVLEELLGERGR